MSIDVPRLKFTVEQYHRMGEAGVLEPDARVELLDGEIIAMTPIGSRHAGCVNSNTMRFSVAFQGRAVVQVQNPVELDDFSEPQPDLTLLRWRRDFYSSKHPRPSDILLAIEVCVTTADLDRGIKLPLYAKARIAEFWLIDLVEDCIDVYLEPKRGKYTRTKRYQRGERIHCAAFPKDAWTVDEVLGDPA